jgi:D-alanyl-D-alanine carboxypeptidase
MLRLRSSAEQRHVIGMHSFRAAAFGTALGSIIILGLLAVGVLTSATTPARAEATILIDAASGKVLQEHNAAQPWYPASTSKLMTLYVTLSAIRDHRITFDTLCTVSHNASSQEPTKMGFAVGTQVTVDNALKMMMVKSANDMAVMLSECIGGTIDNFAQEMTDTAHHLGMSESSFVNPNGLPADGQIVSARDLAILARSLIRDFPQYSFYWHIPAIQYGRRIVRNYNPLLGRFPGTDGMKTGFICASGFNLVATATRDNKELIAVVLGAPSGAARAMKAAEMLESGFRQNPLSWLVPSLGTVEDLKSIDSSPPDLKDMMCGPHRKRMQAAAEEDDEEAGAADPSAGTGADNDNGNSAGDATDGGQKFSVLMSALRSPNGKNANLLSDSAPVVPIVVYTGPTRPPGWKPPPPKPMGHKRVAAAGGKLPGPKGKSATGAKAADEPKPTTAAQ